MEEGLKNEGNEKVSSPGILTSEESQVPISAEQVVDVPEAEGESSDTKKNGDIVVETRSAPAIDVDGDSGDNLVPLTATFETPDSDDDGRFFMSFEEERLLNRYIAQMLRGEQPDFSQLSSDQLQKFIAYVDLLKAAVNTRMRGKWCIFS